MSEKISREEATIELTKAVAPIFAERATVSGVFNYDAIAECVLNLLAVAGYVPVQTDFLSSINQASGYVIKGVPPVIKVSTNNGNPLDINFDKEQTDG